MDGSMEEVLAKLREASMPKKGANSGASPTRAARALARRMLSVSAEGVEAQA